MNEQIFPMKRRVPGAEPRPPRSRRASFVLGVLALGLGSACALFGITPKRSAQAGPAAIDSIEGYQQYLKRNPAAPDAAQHQQRLADLELIEARTLLRPVFDAQAEFFEQPGGEPRGRLAPHVKMIFDSQEEDFFGMQATAIDPDLSGDRLTLFISEGSVTDIPVSHEGEPAHFSIGDPVAIPLIQADSFELEIGQLQRFGGGMRICFFSRSAERCEEGYEFTYDRAGFQKYALAHGGGGSPPLCEYQMSTSNHQESDAITLDPTTRQRRDPDITVRAHNGHLTVTFNGKTLCQVKEPAFQRGYFLLADAPGIHHLSIKLNAGSAPFFVSAASLLEVQVDGPPPTEREGTSYGDYNAFAADLAAFQAARDGGPLPESFTHAYFLGFFGSAEANDAFAALESSTDIDAYLSYLESYPVNAHRRQIEERVFQLAKQANTPEVYEKYLAAFGESDRQLEVKRLVADAQWSAIVSEPSTRSLNRYLKAHPDGYHRARAELLLQGLAYRSKNKAEVDRARQVRKKAAKIATQSPETIKWDVVIVDYLDGSLHFNLNQGPTIKGTATGVQALNLIQAQDKAHQATCELLRRRLPEVETCVYAWNYDRARADQSIPLNAAIQDAVNRFYLPRLKKRLPVDHVRLLELLEQLGQAQPEGSYPDGPYLTTVYTVLGLQPQATFAFYRFAQLAPPGHVSSSATRLRKAAPTLFEGPDMQWILERFGEGRGR